MDWITGIQNAINYIEDHLTGELDYEAIARESFSSPFISRGCSASSAATPWGSTSETAA